jgi:AraC-like DNA-binding protein
MSIELAAEVVETSPRTLRRWLAEERTTWTKVLDRIRFEACEKRMPDFQVTLSEIALELGFSDQAHFARAFRRWTGESPSAYRRRRFPERRAA